MAKKKTENSKKDSKKAKKVDYQAMLDAQTDKVIRRQMESEFKKKNLIE